MADNIAGAEPQLSDEAMRSGMEPELGGELRPRDPLLPSPTAFFTALMHRWMPLVTCGPAREEAQQYCRALGCPENGDMLADGIEALIGLHVCYHDYLIIRDEAP